MAKKSNFSDHRPVAAILEITLVKEDIQRKEQIKGSLFESFRSEGKIFKIMKAEESFELRHLPSD